MIPTCSRVPQFGTQHKLGCRPEVFERQLKIGYLSARDRFPSAIAVQRLSRACLSGISSARKRGIVTCES